MDITFNGRPASVQAATVAALLTELGIALSHVAVERNRQLLPRRLWSETMLTPGDVIEVVQMVGGGC